MEDIKTIAVTVSRGSLAYNLLHNDLYRILREKFKIVILTSAHNDVRFINEFAHPNVTFYPFEELNISWMERLVIYLHTYLIYNPTVNMVSRWGVMGNELSKKSTYLGFMVRKMLFVPLSRFRFLRNLVRWFDLRFLQKRNVLELQKMLQGHNIDLVLSTYPHGNAETALLKAAHLNGIPTVGFPKSWDNLSKNGFRVKPKVLVVWNEFVRTQAVKFNDYDRDDVFVVGVPQYDRFIDRARLVSREEYCKKYGFDPKRKIILFGSEGKQFPTDGAIAEILADFVARENAQLLIRPHYGYKNDEAKFSSCVQKPHVQVDLFNVPSQSLRDSWDYSEAFADNFMNSLYHIDVMVNTASSLAVDAAVFDKPTINIAFDGREPVPYDQSVARWYETYYYQHILSYGAASVVRSKEELISALEMYFKDPTVNQKEREKLREEFTYKLDGCSGDRFAAIIEKILGKDSSELAR